MNKLDKLREFFASELFVLLSLLFAYACAVLDITAFGIAVLLSVLSVLFVLCDDFLPALLPLLLCHALTFLCPEAKWLFVFAVPGGAALCYRFVKNLKNIQNPYSLPGLVGVTVAVTLGGLYTIRPAEYVSFQSLICVLGLGIGCLCAYLMIKGTLPVRRSYSAASRVALSMYLIGVFVAFLILQLFIKDPTLLEGDKNVGLLLSPIALWRNSAATVAVMSLPFIFYYAATGTPWHLLSAVLVYGATVLSGSRGALVCGALVFLLCTVYLIYYRRNMLKPVLAAAGVLCVGVFVFRHAVLDFLTHFLRFNFDITTLLGEVRVQYFLRSFGDFLANPLFGRGFGYLGNDDVYAQGVNWYHSLLPQLIGGLGLLGIAAYGYQFYLRVRLLRAAPRTPFTLAIAVSYIGVLIYSQIDPGIFSPYPFALLTVFFFALLEEVTPGVMGTLYKSHKPQET